MKKISVFFLIFTLGVVTSMCSKDSNPTGSNNPGSTKLAVTKVTYNGWANSYEIANADVKVVVVPAIGRIMYYGLQGGNNILWNDAQYNGKTLPAGQPYTVNGQPTWANFGGDKVWPTEQSQFPAINGYAWPPDHWFDGGAHQVVEIPGGVRISSQVSNFCGAQSIREITLDSTGTQVTIHQTIKKIKKAARTSVEPIDYTIWNVTQIRSPKMAIFNLNPASQLTNRYRTFDNTAGRNLTVAGDVATFVPDAGNTQKAGADSDYWLGAVVDDVVIGEFFRLQPGGDYPDGGLSAEVFTSPQYTELELLSPFEQLSNGEEMSFDISWRLYKLGSDAVTNSQKRDAAVSWLNSFAN